MIGCVISGESLALSEPPLPLWGNGTWPRPVETGPGWGDNQSPRVIPSPILSHLNHTAVLKGEGTVAPFYGQLRGEVQDHMVSRWPSQAGARPTLKVWESQSQICAQGRAVLCPGHPKRTGWPNGGLWQARSGDLWGVAVLSSSCGKYSLVALTHRVLRPGHSLDGISCGGHGNVETWLDAFPSP